MNKQEHIPVMPKECLHYLNVGKEGLWVDGTLGGGSHSELILENSPEGRLISFDMDPYAIETAGKRLERFGKRVELVQDNFKNLFDRVREITEDPVDGIMVDLGVSSMQLTGKADKGFSFSVAGPINMRMDAGTKNTALDLIEFMDSREIARILREYGEERFASRVAKAMKGAFSEGLLTDTKALAEVIKLAIPARYRDMRIHPATRTFQALRIAVNDELGNLREFLPQALELLKPGGRLVVMSFHSLEDRIVRRQFKSWADPCICPPDLPICGCGRKKQAGILTKRPVMALEEEIEMNRRSRSAKLRACEKVTI